MCMCLCIFTGVKRHDKLFAKLSLHRVFTEFCVACNEQSSALVAVVRGANCPLLVQTITDQLAHEHKVLEGTAERKEVQNNFVNCIYLFNYLLRYCTQNTTFFTICRLNHYIHTQPRV